MAASAIYDLAGSGSVLWIAQNANVEHKISWQDGSTAGTIPSINLPVGNASGGHICAVGVKFGATAPNTITVTISDSHGITIFTGTLTASGRIDMDKQVPFVGPLTVAHSGNTTVNALGDTYIMVF